MKSKSTVGIIIFGLLGATSQSFALTLEDANSVRECQGALIADHEEVCSKSELESNLEQVFSQNLETFKSHKDKTSFGGSAFNYISLQGDGDVSDQEYKKYQSNWRNNESLKSYVRFSKISSKLSANALEAYKSCLERVKTTGHGVFLNVRYSAPDNKGILSVSYRAPESGTDDEVLLKSMNLINASIVSNGDGSGFPAVLKRNNGAVQFVFERTPVEGQPGAFAATTISFATAWGINEEVIPAYSPKPAKAAVKGAFTNFAHFIVTGLESKEDEWVAHISVSRYGTSQNMNDQSKNQVTVYALSSSLVFDGGQSVGAVIDVLGAHSKDYAPHIHPRIYMTSEKNNNEFILRFKPIADAMPSGPFAVSLEVYDELDAQRHTVILLYPKMD